MAKLILFYKPFNVLSQFTDKEERDTLSSYIDIKKVYPAGRLDADSEGLLLLTNDGELQHQISHPHHKMEKTYWVQVDGEITDIALKQLCKGVELKDGLTKPAKAKRISDPSIEARIPPIRYRANIPTSWIEIKIKEGKNRQVRRMTAATGFPTLRLVRASIGKWSLGSLKPGEHQLLHIETEPRTQKDRPPLSPKKNRRNR